MPELTADLLWAAWERVYANEGCAGVDSVSVDAFVHQAATALPELLEQATEGTYRAFPLRLLVIEKHPGSHAPRDLLVPTVRDRILQTALARLLSRSFEEEFLEASFGYRPNRGVDSAIARIIQLRDRGWRWIVDADVTSYFDSISHGHLIKVLQEDENVDEVSMSLLRQWIKPVVWDGRELRLIRRGIAQGSPISPLLANVYLEPLDRKLSRGGNKLIRYADDFVVLCESEEAARQAHERTSEVLGELGLTLNAAKSRITSFEQGFQFLGVRFTASDVMIPWKSKSAGGRVIFLAHPMPPRLLKPYRQPVEPAPAPPRAHSRPPEPPDPEKGNPNEMPYLYVTQQGAILRKSGDRFLIEQDGQILADIPYHRIEQILVFGNIQITSQAMAEALDHNVGLSLLTRHGRFRGALNPPPGKNIELRIAQYSVRQDAVRSLDFAKRTVRAKLANSLAVLERYRRRSDAPADAGGARATIESIIERHAVATTTAELDGYEGAAANAYFDALMLFNRSKFTWPGRHKHPAPDPLNALLSLAYTLIMHELNALTEACGLDPAIGFLHEIDGARPSLALDLMEPFRAAIADRLILTLINRGQIRPEDFEPRDRNGSMVLKPDSMRAFFEEYEKWMLTPIGPKPGVSATTFRNALRADIVQFGKALRGAVEWAPFGFDAAEEEGEEKEICSGSSATT